MFSFLLVLSAIFFIYYIYLKLYTPLQYWKELDVPYLKAWPLFGNIALTVFKKKSLATIIQDAYEQFSNHRYFGIYLFSNPNLVVRDLDLIKRIGIRDFEKFPDRPNFLKSSDPFWSKSIIVRKGKEWHDLRTTLSPAFSNNKMKLMFSLMDECAQEFVKYFKKDTSELITIEMRNAFSRYGNDSIASCAFGVKCDSLQNVNNDFFRMGKELTDFSGFRMLKMLGITRNPFLMKLLKLELFTNEMKSFFTNIVNESIRYREKSKIVRPDMIHLLREAQKGRLRYENENQVPDSGFAAAEEFGIGKSKFANKSPITEEDMVIQAMVFFSAGYETVTTILCHLTYELAVNPDVQKKLRNEIDQTWKTFQGNLTYEALTKMEYLDMVLSETLRLWNSFTFTRRISMEPYTIEPILPHEKPLYLPAGTVFYIPLHAIQRDAKYFPNPTKFDPERFRNRNKSNIRDLSFIPFGVGPRNCIGSRFGLLQIKILVYHLLAQFEIVPVKETVVPWKISTSSLFLRSDSGYWLGLRHRNLNKYNSNVNNSDSNNNVN